MKSKSVHFTHKFQFFAGLEMSAKWKSKHMAFSLSSPSVGLKSFCIKLLLKLPSSLKWWLMSVASTEDSMSLLIRMNLS